MVGKQQLSLQHVMSMVSSSGGEHLREHAEQKGLDPALINGVMSLVKGGGGGDAAAAEEGDGGGGGGLQFGNLLKIVTALTKEGAAGGGVGADGFLSLLGGMGGGGEKKGEGVLFLPKLSSKTGLTSKQILNCC
jgi:hypothetical protein